jgi:hypothetical protein
MKTQRQSVQSIIALLAILSLVVLLSFAVATDGQNAYGLSFALVSLAAAVVFALPSNSFRRNRTSVVSVSSPILSQQFERSPPAIS